MLKVVFAVALALLAVGSASAGDKLLRGPTPSWVKRADVASPPLASEGEGLRTLFEDRQLRIGPEGVSEYVEDVTQVRTPLGLAQAGSVSLAWSPDTDTITVHRVEIRRGGETIDVLARQDFTVIRRETNLEFSMLDGVLSATLQPEGLRAGDTIVVAYTRTRNDPVLQGRADYALFGRTFGAIDRMRLRAVWDAKRDVTWRAGDGLDAPRVSKSGGQVELLIDMKDVKSVKGPRGAPPRYFPRRDLIVSEFKTWGDVAALVAPAYAKAVELAPDSPLQAELATIRKASPDPKVRAALALQLAKDQVRYLALTMSNGGYLPATADETWRRRFGDCKAKSVLLVALLRELGIEAEATVVDSDGGHLLDGRPAGLSAFDHVIVRAVIEGKAYWLDATRSGDRNIDAVAAPRFGKALPLRPAGSDLVEIVRPPLDGPNATVTIAIDARKGIEAANPVHAEMTIAGDGGVYLALGMKNMTAADRDKMLKNLWSGYRWIRPTTVALVEDAATGRAKVVMDGEARLDWQPKATGGRRFLLIPGAGLGSTAEFKRDDGPDSGAPWAIYDHPSWATMSFRVRLPEGGRAFQIEGADVEKQVAGRAYARRSRIENDTAVIETSVRTTAPEFPASEAAAASDALKQMAQVRVVLRAPPFYMPTDGDIAVWQEEKPKTAFEYVGRATRYLAAARDDLAAADLDRAIEVDPKNAYAWSNRGIVNARKSAYDQAAADFAKAIELDPRNYVALQGQAGLAMRDRRFQDAVALLTRAADLAPSSTFALSRRAAAWWALGDADKALADLDVAEKAEPGSDVFREFRHQIYAALGQRERALAELDAALKLKPDDDALHVRRGGNLALIGREDEAEREFARALEIRPSAEAYMTRAQYRKKSDIEGRLADLEKAAALSPSWTAIPAAQATALADGKRFDEALKVLDRALRTKPDDQQLLEEHAEVQIRAGRKAAAKEIAALRTRAEGNAMAWNALCWMAATRGYDLGAALGDCDAGLKVSPKAAELIDSRAFVLLRLGRLDDALAAYEQAVAMRPYQADSLYGRGVTRLRLGQVETGKADLARATGISPKIGERWRAYGVLAEAASAGAQPAR